MLWLSSVLGEFRISLNIIVHKVKALNTGIPIGHPCDSHRAITVVHVIRTGTATGVTAPVATKGNMWIGEIPKWEIRKLQL